MTAETKIGTGQTAVSLLTGIIGDVQRLVEQQFQLTRSEIEVEVRRRSSAVTVCLVGFGLLLLSGVETSAALAHFLYWMISPNMADHETLPLWSCHAIVGVLFLVVGMLVSVVGRARFCAAGGEKRTGMDVLQEDVSWMKRPS